MNFGLSMLYAVLQLISMQTRTQVTGVTLLNL